MQKPVKRFLSGITSVMLALSCFSARPVSSYAADPDYKSWLQSDSRWGDTPMGYGGATVAGVGCLATSLAILAVHCGAVTSDSFNPGTFVDSLNDLGGFDYSGSLVSWNLVSEVVPNLECEGKYHVPSETSEYEYIQKLEELQDAGYYSVCYVGHHWVLVDYIENGSVYMCDPAGSDTDMLSAYPYDPYTHDTIRYFSYSGSPATTPDNNNNDNPDNNNSESVYEVTASALNMRENPDTASETLAVIPNGEKVTVTEISDGWGKTSYNGAEGWISMEYTQYVMSGTLTDAPAVTPEETVTTANTTISFEETSTSEYTVISETAEITDCYGENVLCTVPEKSVVKVKSTDNGFAEILFGDSSALIALKDIAPVPDTDTLPEKGDINNDGVIDKLDISTLNENMLAEKELPDKISIFTSKGRYAADCNNDGAVDNNDVIQLLIEICSR